MSRIGLKIIPIPSGLTLSIEPSAITVKGPKGTLEVQLPRGIRIEKKDGHLEARRAEEADPALHGLVRSLVANAVYGVSQGFEKHLDIVGIGYRAEVKGDKVALSLGYSHPIEFPIPQGLSVSVEKQTHLIVRGADKQRVGQTAADLRGLRPPDPYKNKGVRYTNERLKKKAGKAAGGAGAAKQ
ncbi:MAG TPA: 50S ribosomal protein L6 [Terriglobia bacterium]|nr:50S ribosomal protein L6 [Terriglobia bacterium]